MVICAFKQPAGHQECLYCRKRHSVSDSLQLLSLETFGSPLANPGKPEKWPLNVFVFVRLSMCFVCCLNVSILFFFVYLTVLWFLVSICTKILVVPDSNLCLVQTVPIELQVIFGNCFFAAEFCVVISIFSVPGACIYLALPVLGHINRQPSP